MPGAPWAAGGRGNSRLLSVRCAACLRGGRCAQRADGRRRLLMSPLQPAPLRSDCSAFSFPSPFSWHHSAAAASHEQHVGLTAAAGSRPAGRAPPRWRVCTSSSEQVRVWDAGLGPDRHQPLLIVSHALTLPPAAPRRTPARSQRLIARSTGEREWQRGAAACLARADRSRRFVPRRCSAAQSTHRPPRSPPAPTDDMQQFFQARDRVANQQVRRGRRGGPRRHCAAPRCASLLLRNKAASTLTHAAAHTCTSCPRSKQRHRSLWIRC